MVAATPYIFSIILCKQRKGDVACTGIVAIHSCAGSISIFKILFYSMMVCFQPVTAITSTQFSRHNHRGQI